MYSLAATDVGNLCSNVHDGLLSPEFLDYGGVILELLTGSPHSWKISWGLSSFGDSGIRLSW